MAVPFDPTFGAGDANKDGTPEDANDVQASELMKALEDVGGLPMGLDQASTPNSETLHPKPETPNPKPQTPNPKPQIPNPPPHPTPHTPHPTPQTPHPKPQTQNLKPKTPTPKPWSHHLCAIRDGGLDVLCGLARDTTRRATGVPHLQENAPP